MPQDAGLKAGMAQAGKLALRGTGLGVGGTGGEFVGAVVVGVGGVALGPGPGDFVAVDLGIEGLPEVLVHNGLFGGGHPSAALPIVDPGGDAVFEVFGVRDYFDFAVFLEGAEALDGGGELHTVVGGVGREAAELFLVLVVAEDGGPAAATGIPEAGAVGNELDFFHAVTGVEKNESTRSRIAAGSDF